MDEKLKKYGKSKKENFFVMDTIGVPHLYCIGPKHVGYASDNWAGMLGEGTIEEAEKEGIYCCTCKGDLKYKEHKIALLVKCLKSFDAKSDKKECEDYLKSITDMCEKDKYAGFSFLQGF